MFELYFLFLLVLAGFAIDCRFQTADGTVYDFSSVAEGDLIFGAYQVAFCEGQTCEAKVDSDGLCIPRGASWQGVPTIYKDSGGVVHVDLAEGNKRTNHQLWCYEDVTDARVISVAAEEDDEPLTITIVAPLSVCGVPEEAESSEDTPEPTPQPTPSPTPIPTLEPSPSPTEAIEEVTPEPEQLPVDPTPSIPKNIEPIVDDNTLPTPVNPGLPQTFPPEPYIPPAQAKKDLTKNVAGHWMGYASCERGCGSNFQHGVDFRMLSCAQGYFYTPEKKMHSMRALYCDEQRVLGSLHNFNGNVKAYLMIMFNNGGLQGTVNWVDDNAIWQLNADSMDYRRTEE